MTTEELAEFLAAETKEYVEAAVARALEKAEAQLDATVARLVEAQLAALAPALKGEKGDPGQDGKDIDRAQLDAAVAFAVGLIPVPKDGAPGKDGKDADPEIIRTEVARAVAAIPVPKDGVDGRDGRDGVDGANGRDVDPEVIRAAVAEAVAALPAPKDGRDGEDGKDVDLLVVKALVAGEVASAVSALPLPKDGRDGKDGIASEDQLKAMVVAEVGATVPPAIEEAVTKVSEALPRLEYRAQYQAGTVYRRGNNVTYGGSLWICIVEETSVKPDEPGTKDWQLAVKKGRDGRDGKDFGGPRR